MMTMPAAKKNVAETGPSTRHPRLCRCVRRRAKRGESTPCVQEIPQPLAEERRQKAHVVADDGRQSELDKHDHDAKQSVRVHATVSAVVGRRR